MFKEIDFIKTNHSFKRTLGDYLQFGLFYLSTFIAILVLTALLTFGELGIQEMLIIPIIGIGLISISFMVRQQWNRNFAFETYKNDLSAEENLKLILSIIKDLNLDIIDNNIHRTLVKVQGRTSPFSLGSVLTFVYSNNEILINSKPRFGSISIWPFYRTDMNAVTQNLKKS